MKEDNASNVKFLLYIYVVTVSGMKLKQNKFGISLLQELIWSELKGKQALIAKEML
jgi:hypothetical protein